jgi:hypothetical protein
MANITPGVLIFNNWLDLMVEALTPEQTIELLKCIQGVSNDNEYNPKDPIVITHWFHMREIVVANVQKYKNKCAANKRNGNLGGRPITQNNPSKPKITHNKQSKSKSIAFTCVKGEESTSLGEVSPSLTYEETMK